MALFGRIWPFWPLLRPKGVLFETNMSLFVVFNFGQICVQMDEKIRILSLKKIIENYRKPAQQHQDMSKQMEKCCP